MLVVGMLLVGLLHVAAFASQDGRPDERQPDIEVFIRKGCLHCEAAKAFLKQLQAERPSLLILLRDVATEPSALARLKELGSGMGLEVGVPTFYLRGELIVGFRNVEHTGSRIKALLDKPPPGTEARIPEGACSTEITSPCETDTSPLFPQDESLTLPLIGQLTVQGLGLPLFTFTIGLLDGFNPCSMWVLLFMISMLATLQDRRKMALIAGTFVAVEGIAYFAFMAAWLNIFLFIGLSRISEMVLGAIATLAGAVNMKEFWRFRRGISLSIPDTAKPQMYARIRRILQAENITAALIGTVVLALLVQIIEFLCTAGFPALYTRILTLKHLEGFAYYGYLLLYNVAYMFDDVIVLSAGIVTLSQRRLQEREGRWLKLISGLIMVGIGLLLILKPEWLMW